MERVAPENCQNCGAATEWQPLFAAADQTVRCGRCDGWAWLGPMTQAPAELYGEEYFNGGEYRAYDASRPIHQLNFRRKLRILERRGLLPADLRVLEVGSATGEFLQLTRARSQDRQLGIEASAYCRRLANERGLRTIDPAASDADAQIAALRPTLIAAWDTWEHLPNPGDIFDRLIARGAADLTVALTTVDASSRVARRRGARWRQFHPPTHLYYPTRKSFVEYFRARGFVVEYHRAFGYYRPLLEYAKALGGWAERLFTRLRLQMLPLYLNLYDTQFVVARRVTPPAGR